MSVLAPPESQENEKKESPKFPQISERVENIKGKIVETVKSPLVWVRNWVRNEIDKRIPSFLKKEKIDADTETNVRKADEEVTEPGTNEELTEKENDSEMPLEIKEKFIDADGELLKKRTRLLDDFTKISQELAPEEVELKRDPVDLQELAMIKQMIERDGTVDKLYEGIQRKEPEFLKTSNLNSLAEIRLQKLKEGGSFTPDDHDKEFNKVFGVAENFQIDYFDTAAEAASYFQSSEKHWRRMREPHQRMGGAMDVVYDKKSGKRLYCLVILYSDLKDTAKDPDMSKPEIPTEFNSAADVVALNLYLDALKAHLDWAGLKYEDHDRKKFESNIKLGEEELKRGSFFVTITDKEGRPVDYMISVNPPLALRWIDENETVGILFKDLLEDFRKESSKKEEPVEKAGKVIKFPQNVRLRKAG